MAEESKGKEMAAAAAGEAVDARVTWLEARAASIFRHIKQDKFSALFRSEANMAIFDEFLNRSDARSLVISGDTAAASTDLPSKKVPKTKYAYFLRLSSEKLAPSTMDANVLCSDMSPGSLEHFAAVLTEVYIPLLSNVNNQEGWGEVASKEIVDKLHGFLASVSITIGASKGETCLPLPPIEEGPSSAVGPKDLVHLLEGALITWTKQIKNVLKQDPEGLLKQGMHPTPDVEIEFWKTKASNLNAIFDQLQSEAVRKVLKTLDAAKSTYCTPFAKLCKEVFTSRLEANDNVKYLRTLEVWFDKLNRGDSFPDLVQLFKPTMHITLLIWKNSRHYNVPSRLVVLIREICNALINQACNFVSGKQIFSLIESEAAGEAVEKLKTTLRVCGAFKSTYFEYKETANAECPDNAWRIQNNALFMRLDSFLERCHDILDLTETIVQFSKLARIEVGGTKGKTLTNSVQQIFVDFEAAVNSFKAVPYDIIDVGKKQFDDDFYEFRCRIKELERRLGSVLTQGFDDCATIYGKFKLLDSFEGLLERPIIQDELEKKHASLVQAYGKDLKRVQELFLTERDAPPITWNLPPIAGALSWCRGLKERILDPMAKLRQLNNNNKMIMEREEAKEVVKVYATIIASLEDYEHQKIEEWGSDVERSSQAKLKLPLLQRVPDATGKHDLLSVNFDPALVRLLREVKYFLLLGLEVPPSALDIYKKAETYRKQTGNLDLMVNKYNRIILEMLPVERPLLATHLTKIENTVAAGVKDLNWKSHAIDGFISECQACVNTAYDILINLKRNLADIQKELDKWSKKPLLARKAKPMSPDEFTANHEQLKLQRYNEIKEGGGKIDKFLKSSHATLKVSKGHPDWRSYVDFVNGVVCEGLVKVVVVSIQFLVEQLDTEGAYAKDKMPMLLADLTLVGDRVRFNPEAGETTTSGKCLRDLVTSWVDSFFNVATLFKRLDDAEGRYVKELVNDVGITMLISRLNDCLVANERLFADFKAPYDTYSYLWQTDIQSSFAAFLERSYYSTESGMKVPNLGNFNAEIAKYRKIQAQLNEFKTPTDVGWLRINSEPIKQSLSTYITKWSYMFSEHLHDYVLGKLTELHDFIVRVEAGLGEPVGSGDKDALKRVMGHMRDVRRSADSRAEMFAPLRDAVAALKSYGMPLEGTRLGDVDAVEYLESAPMKWETTVNKTFRKKEEILPLQNAEVDAIRTSTEAFTASMKAFRKNFRAKAPLDFTGASDDAYRLIDEFEAELANMEASAAKLNELEDLFEIKPVSTYAETAETRVEVRLLKEVWDARGLVEHSFEKWKAALWKEIDTDSLLDQTKRLQVVVRTMGAYNPQIKTWLAFKDLEASVNNMGATLPLVSELHAPAMRERHWKMLSSVCRTKAINPKDPKFCLEDMLELKLHTHANDVMEIVETAQKELKIEKKMTSIEEIWSSLVLEYIPHKDSDVRIVKASDEIVESLEAHQLELQSMIGLGKFVEYFRDKVEHWQRALGNVETVLKEWLSVTKAWASLEAIFLGSADIRSQLPDDTKRFEGIDQEFKDLMKAAVEVQNVVEACSVDGRGEGLKGMTRALELCQKSLNEYLDMKKKIFPRFYFVSNVALLDILSNGNNPPKIMPYVGDCYDSLTKLTFLPAAVDGAVPNTATQMIAKDGEVVDLTAPFVISGAVENWLNALTIVQQKTLAEILHVAMESALSWEVDVPRQEWLKDLPAQIVLVGSQIMWTEEAERSLGEFEGGVDDAVKKYLGVCNDRLNNLIQMVLGKMGRSLRTKVISLITMDVHGRDTVQRLIDGRAEGPSSFMWAQQLRFYWVNDTKEVDIKITDYRSKYFYEWVGNSGRLVITPLTDRCYITLTMALRLMLGGAPAGPAGTGKTETTKDLARALALPCYVFNCSDQMNYQTMADIFKGLSQTGSWGCFDEFNRIPIEVLSVVATQVKQVLDAITLFSVPDRRPEKYRSAPKGQPPVTVGSFELMGDEITLIPTVGFFITMNPGYAGRTELPENLKALFRSCAMIRPDLALICENMVRRARVAQRCVRARLTHGGAQLMSEGFAKARPLSIKFVTLYQLSSELLSPQAHYDWGLRAVKSVLRVAGSLKRAEPDLEEEAILMRALRDFNTPKMPLQDLPIFLRLIQDLFPTCYGIATKFNETLRAAAVETCKSLHLQHDAGFVVKIVQFQELLDVRHSVMLIGPAGCGKTTIWKTLAATHNRGKPKPVAVYDIVNPKAVTSDELYGCMTLSKDWKDGVLSIIMRGMSKNYKELGYNEHQTAKWSVLDGDIDAVWIESMNTVMDDNKVLTLVSNERIPLSEAMRMVFEINSLANATPATVSRAGMLFINETDVGWRPYVESWIASRPHESEKAYLPQLFDKYTERVIEDVRRKKKAVPISTISSVMGVCHLLDGLLTYVTKADGKPEDVNPDVLEAQFVFATMWAFGGPLIVDKNRNYRRDFSDFLVGLMAGTYKLPKDPADALCFDFYFDTSSNEFTHWSKKVPDYVPVPIGVETSFSQLFVGTVDSVRMTALLHTLVSRGHAAMFVGNAGSGKTTLVREFLRNLNEDVLSTTINLNYYMDSAALQVQVEGAIDKRSGRVFGPPTGKKLIYFTDDLNLPYKETYGTQNSLELLRQIVDHRSFYDRTDLGFRKEVTDVQFIAGMNPTAGSFSVNARLQRHFTTFSCMMPSVSDLHMIYKSILDGHLSSFATSVQNLSNRMTDATIALHDAVSTKFLPSATRFVYNWNMRELSAIYQGLCLAVKDFYPGPMKFVRLWVHEASRVFGDRLINESDADQFNQMLRAVAKVHFDEDEEKLHSAPVIFTSFAAQPAAGGEATYLPIPDGQAGWELLGHTLKLKLDEYNQSSSIMDLVLFQQAMEHVCRICRIISNPSGNAMLVGVGGSGKQSLSRLAASICGYEVKQLAVTSRYTVADLKESLKEMYRNAGVKGTGMVFLLTDSQIVDDKFLVYVNDMLSSGWIAGLFEQDELDGIFSSLRTEAKAAGIHETPDAMLEFFISRVKRNLHIVLCFSPVGDTFRVRARRFPGLINSTAIDWFHAWPREALVSVAKKFLVSMELGTPELTENVAFHMAEVHLSVTKKSVDYLTAARRYNYVTPKTFLELISFYKRLLGEKRELNGQLITRLDTGLSTLRKTANDVAALQVDLKATMIKVEEKKDATEALLVQMGKQRAEAEEQQAIATAEAAKASKASAEAAKIEDEASVELAEARPAMIAASKAVDCLSKSSLTELKNFKAPPSGVDMVTGACLMMIDKEFKNLSWDRSKKMMAKVDGFLAALKAFDAENMPDELIRGLTPYIQNETFNADDMTKKSEAAANLCSWVCNIYKYNRIYVKVKPLMDRLKAAQENKANAEAQLARVMAVVAEVESRVKKLQDSLVQATNEKLEVERVAKACMDRLGLANRLVSGLASENARWGAEIEKLRERGISLVGDTLLASSFASYLGAFDFEYRTELWKRVWIADLQLKTIPLSDGVDPLSQLTNDGKNAQMMSEGLPSDRISIENGAIITSSQRWPLIIDPQLQGIKWLRSREGSVMVEKKKEKKEEKPAEPAPGDVADDAPVASAPVATSASNLVVLQLSQSSWLRILIRSIQNGNTVIIENLGEDVDATLEPVLSRAVYRKGRTLFLRVGGDEVEYDPKFKLYLQTKLANPHYKPEIQAQCTLVNFIATEKGLEDQLLARAVNEEKRELENQRQELQAAFNRYKIQLLELENQLLERLANAPEDILSDVPLIEGLEATKKAATEINIAVELGKQTEIAIEKARQVYVPIATEGAMLYFMLTQLNAIEHMYQYSLDSFVLYFYKAIATAKKDDDVTKRVHSLRECLRLTIYTWVARGLKEAHKLILQSQLTFQLMRRGMLAEEFEPRYFEFLLRGPKKPDESCPVDWLSVSAWQAVLALAELEEFAKLPSDIVEASQRFKEWFNHVTPESEKLPLDWALLDKQPFKKLLVLRCMRPDRLNVALSLFVAHTLPDGNRFVNCDSTLNSQGVLEDTLGDATPATPIYFILSPGADVVADVDRLAKKFGFEKAVTYHNVSMGQGQDIVAMEKLEMGHKQGHWVILNNVHLMPRWLLELEKKLDQFLEEKSHADFRVFLTSDPSSAIPIGVLNRSIKITNEPPAGLKANLKRAFCSFSPEQVNEVDTKQKSILFGLCHFHAVMIERKKFGSKGFNMNYPFAIGDLRDSATCLANYLSENSGSKVPWDDLRYIFGQIMYGGHIVNDFDRLLCVTYLEHFMRDELLDEMEMFPFPGEDKASFKSPSPTTYDRYLEHIEREFTADTPIAFGLHPNAEIGFRTDQSIQLFKTLQELQPREQVAGEGGSSPQRAAENAMNDIMDRFGEIRFDLEEIAAAIEEVGPYQNVFLLECEQMNRLLVEVSRSLAELLQGLNGELTMSDAMEELMNALFLERIPPSWKKLAWPSMRSLGAWLINMNTRVLQLQEWVAAPADIPKCVWVSGLFNPQSFLTAVMQQTAQRTGQELDKLIIMTDVTKKAVEEIDAQSRDGAYVHGLALEGARWDATNQLVDRAKPREMFCPMPVINCRAMLADKVDMKGVFSCPVYKTEARGPTYVFSAQLKSKSPPARWIMAGVALLMDFVAA